MMMMISFDRNNIAIDQRWEYSRNGLILMLKHFREPWFPRTISTGAGGRKQYTVYSIDEAMMYYKASLYEDCYLNMFPNYEAMVRSGALDPTFNPVPNHFMIDLDREHFQTDQEFNTAV